MYMARQLTLLFRCYLNIFLFHLVECIWRLQLYRWEWQFRQMVWAIKRGKRANCNTYISSITRSAFNQFLSSLIVFLIIVGKIICHHNFLKLTIWMMARSSNHITLGTVCGLISWLFGIEDVKFYSLLLVFFIVFYTLQSI